jgi:hypothetical protein
LICSIRGLKDFFGRFCLDAKRTKKIKAEKAHLPISLQSLSSADGSPFLMELIGFTKPSLPNRKKLFLGLFYSSFAGILIAFVLRLELCWSILTGFKNLLGFRACLRKIRANSCNSWLKISVFLSQKIRIDLF